MAHGKVTIWYRSLFDGKIIKAQGVFRMGQPHGHFTFMSENDSILAEGRYSKGQPLENLHKQLNAKSKQHILKIPKKIVL